MTKTYYPITTTAGQTIHTVNFDRTSQTADPGTGSPTEVQVTVAASATQQLAFAFYSPSGEPDSASWPNGTSGDEYICQVDVATAGGDLTYGVNSATGGHHARVNSALSSELETETEASAIGNTGTGIKIILFEVESWNTGSASDRYEVLIGCNNSSMMAEVLGINVQTSNTFIKGPWVVATDSRYQTKTLRKTLQSIKRASIM